VGQILFVPDRIVQGLADLQAHHRSGFSAFGVSPPADGSAADDNRLAGRIEDSLRRKLKHVNQHGNVLSIITLSTN
jgi:hypothetical protein